MTSATSSDVRPAVGSCSDGIAVPARPRGAAARMRRPLLLPMVLLAAELTILVAVHVGQFVELSPVDELMHFDNVVRSSEPDLILDERDPIAQETLQEVGCRRIHDSSWSVAGADDPCRRAAYDPNDAWWHGLNSSVGHVPLYYLVTGLAARSLRAVVPAFGLLTWARLLGIAWALAGCYLVLRCAVLLRVRPMAVAAVLAMVLAVPAQLEASAMVNPDAALLLVGGGLLFTALHVESRRWPWWTLPVAVALAILVDPSSFIAVLFVGGYFVVRALRRGQPTRHRFAHVAMALAVVLVSAATTLAWTVSFRALTDRADFTGSPQAVAYATERLAPADVVGRSAVFALLPPIDQPHAPAALRTPVLEVLVAAAGLLLVAAVVGAALRARSGDPLDALAGATTLALLSGAPLLILATFTVSRLYFGIPSRYGLSALAPMALVVAGTTGPVGRTVTAVVATALFGTTVLSML